MPRLELFPFRYRNTVTGKWVKARYVAEPHEIAARYAEWEIIGPPEIRDVDPNARYFTPWKVVPHADLMRMMNCRQRCSRTYKHHRRLMPSKRSSSTYSFAATSPTALGADGTRK